MDQIFCHQINLQRITNGSGQTEIATYAIVQYIYIFKRNWNLLDVEKKILQSTKIFKCHHRCRLIRLFTELFFHLEICPGEWRYIWVECSRSTSEGFFVGLFHSSLFYLFSCFLWKMKVDILKGQRTSCLNELYEHCCDHHYVGLYGVEYTDTSDKPRTPQVHSEVQRSCGQRLDNLRGHRQYLPLPPKKRWHLNADSFDREQAFRK